MLTPMQSRGSGSARAQVHRLIAAGVVRLIVRKMFYFWNYYELPDNVDYEIMQRFSPLLDYLNRSFPPGGWPTLALPFQGGWIPVASPPAPHLRQPRALRPRGIYLTRAPEEPPALYVLLFGYMGTVLLFFNFSRFRAPVVPILALFAAECLMAAGRWMKRLSTSRSRSRALRGDGGKGACPASGPEGRIACALLAVLALA